MAVDNDVKCPHCGNKFDFSPGFIKDNFENNQLKAMCDKCRRYLIFSVSALPDVADSEMEVGASVMIDVQPVDPIAAPPERKAVKCPLGEAILLEATVGKTTGDEEQLDNISPETKKDLDELFGGE